MDVYIFSIPRATHRQELCRGALLSRGVPHDCIKIFNGPDHQDFATTKDICDRAAQDGFPQLQIYENFSKPASVAQLYGHLLLFKMVQDMGEPILYVHDDVYIKRNYTTFDAIKNNISRHDPLFIGATTWTTLDEYDVPFLNYDVISHGIMEGIPPQAKDSSGIVFPGFYSWFVNSFFMEGYREDIHLDTFFWEMAGKAKKGFYWIPAPDNSNYFPVEYVKSLIHDTDKLVNENEWVQLRYQ